MNVYALGFVFSPDKKEVVLMKKSRPNWQAGLLNGVGGKVEKWETPFQAMQRKFQEETGVRLSSWQKFAVLYRADWVCHCFFFQSDIWPLAGLHSATDEEVAVLKVADVLSFEEPQKTPSSPHFSLRWLIPLALDEETPGIYEMRYSAS